MTPEYIFADEQIRVVEEEFSSEDASDIKAAMVIISELMIRLGPKKGEAVIKIINAMNDRLNASI